MHRYDRAYRLASEFLENLDAKHHWRKPENLFKAMGWELIPYGPFDFPELSSDAYSSYRYGKFFILYFEGQLNTRTNYNFHHEAGHIIAAHPILYGDSLCKSSAHTDKKYIEVEATIIGRNIFLNAYIINELIKITGNEEEVKNYFCEEYTLSRDYVDARFSFLRMDLKNMIYPEWVKLEVKKENIKFLIWQSRIGCSSKFIQKYVTEYKYTPTKLLKGKSLTLPLKQFYFERTGQFNYEDEYGICGSNEIVYEYTGTCDNLNPYGENFKNKKAIIKVYEYPKGKVSQVSDIELIDKYI